MNNLRIGLQPLLDILEFGYLVQVAALPARFTYGGPLPFPRAVDVRGNHVLTGYSSPQAGT
jgi:hypothetical protein